MGRKRNASASAWGGLLAVLAVVAQVSLSSAVARGAERHAGLARALDARGWVELPPEVIDVRYSGPTPAAAPGTPPGPVWYSTTVIDDNARPHHDERYEQAFVRSVEAAHAGKTRLIEGGTVLLVDPKRRLWAVAAHTPPAPPATARCPTRRWPARGRS
jgi:hypothetical protein